MSFRFSASACHVGWGASMPPENVCEALDLIADKWAMLIVAALADGPLRFSVLVRALPGISHKTLSQRLKELERYQLLERQQYPTIPPKVIYGLTGRGQTLVGPTAQLLKWAGAQAASGLL